MVDEREKNVYLAKLAEQAERYDEMAEHMKVVAQCNQELSVEERNLISVAYKNAVGSRRASWRIISSVEQKEASKGNTQNVDMAKAYRIRVETELHRICEEILSLIDNSLIPTSSSGECKVFYYKMKGDYFRYIAEFTEGEGKTGAANSAHDACALLLPFRNQWATMWRMVCVQCVQGTVERKRLRMGNSSVPVDTSLSGLRSMYCHIWHSSWP